MNKILYKIIELIFAISLGILMTIGIVSLGTAWVFGIFYLFGNILGIFWVIPNNELYIGMIVFYSALIVLITFPFVYIYEERFR